MPRKNCRTHVRNRGSFRLSKDTRNVAMFDFLQANEADWHNWTMITVLERIAEAMAEAGEAEKVFLDVDGVSTLLGWRRTIKNLASRSTPSTLTLATMEAVANAKDSKLSPAEQRQVEKMLVWHEIGDDRAVCVRPRVSAEHQLLADALRRRCA